MVQREDNLLVHTFYIYMTRGKRAQCKYPAWSMAEAARKQMALMNKCRMNKVGRGVVDQPFYTKFNR